MSIPRSIFIQCVFFVCLAFTARAEPIKPAAEPFPPGTQGNLFTVHGSNTIGANLMKQLLKTWLSARGATAVRAEDKIIDNEYRVSGVVDGRRISIDVAAHGSSTGYRGLQSSKADLAMSSRPIKTGEAVSLNHLGDLRGFQSEHIVALDALAIIAHPSNPIASLTIDQLGKIFSGEINRWEQLGDGSGHINIYARDDNSGTYDTFASLVLGEQYSLHSSAQRFESNDRLSDSVSRDPNGIGFTSLASVRQAKALAVSDGDSRPMIAGTLSVATEDYPLTRRLFLYVPTSRTRDQIPEFLAFMHSDAGQAVVRESGFVSQALTSVAPATDLQGPSEYLAMITHAERLSVNFRFDKGSARLDNKARRDALRIAEYLARPENRDKKILLIGFSDEQQTERRAEVLSKLRALRVAQALREQGISTQPVAGFGADLPVAGDTDQGKIKNRRVEVWVRPADT